MSTRKSKKHGKSKAKESAKSDIEERRTMIPVTFKYAGRFATMTSKSISLCNTMGLDEIERTAGTVEADTTPPPDAKALFELFFEHEISPKISKHAQEAVNSKKAVSESWEFQTEQFKAIFEKRAAALRSKWEELTLGKGQSVSYAVQSHHHHQDPKQAMERTVIFKYYSVHSSAKTNRHIHFSTLSLEELLRKIKLSVDHQPPNGVDIFSAFYYDEILPFLKKSGQQSIRGKKDLAKCWKIQTKVFKEIYEERAALLRDEWLRMKQRATKSKGSPRRRAQGPGPVEVPSNKVLSEVEVAEAERRREVHLEQQFKERKVKRKKSAHKERVDCSVVLSILYFAMMAECAEKEDCCLMVVDDDAVKAAQYRALHRWRDGADLRALRRLHFRIFIAKFDVEDLRVFSWRDGVRLIFVEVKDRMKGHELLLFELKFDALIHGLRERVNHREIDCAVDHRKGVLAVTVPML